ncbi:unnamed protein product [Pedinophyceae sp. YPF-701]|nr:unnamed protein product [Pedinophyceae sp. YPF-701]
MLSSVSARSQVKVPVGRGHARPCQARAPARRTVLVRAASDDDDDDFEERIRRLKLAKGQTPMGEGKKKEGTSGPKTAKKAPKKVYDYSNEKLHYEGPPHRGDLAVNIALTPTLVWLPLTFAAIGRAAFVKYKFTDRRISVITTAPWKNDQLDVPYQEVKNVQVIGRGVGLWGDMVITLADNSKVELRALDKFIELRDYINDRRKELGGSASSSPSRAAADTAGFS